MYEIEQKKINKDIKTIVNKVLELCNSTVIAIILYGSYGRDEGAFYADRNGIIHTYNDYDLILIVDEYIDSTILTQIAHLLEEKLDVKWIDISQKKRSKLEKLKLTIFNYDLKYGSRVIYGDKDILDNIPKYKSNEISLKEAETLYFTRLYTFIGTVGDNNFVNGVKDENARFFRNQMAKAILAVVDCLLLVIGKYNYSYKKRVLLLQQYYPEKSSLIELAKWALSEKLNPKDNSFNGQDTKNFYTKILKVYLGEIFFVLSKYHKRKINSTDDIKIARLFSLNEFVLRLKYIITTRNIFGYQRRVNIDLAQSYIAEAFLKPIDAQNLLLKKSKNIIKMLDSQICLESNNWNDIKQIIADLRLKL